jgi:hypothetical protein
MAETTDRVGQAGLQFLTHCDNPGFAPTFMPAGTGPWCPEPWLSCLWPFEARRREDAANYLHQ